MKNWYKQSKAINIPNDIMGIIDSLVPMIKVRIENLGQIASVDNKYRMLLPEDISGIQFSIIDPYTKENREIKIIFKYKIFISSLSGFVYVPNSMNKHYTLGFGIPAKKSSELDYDVKEKYIKKNFDFNDDDIRSILIHEMWHIIDPKTMLDEKRDKTVQPKDESNYYSDKKEIDAYQTDIISHIIKGLRDKTINIELVQKGLMSNVDSWLSLLGIGLLSRKAYNYWLKNNVEAMKLFRKRLYSAISEIQVTASWYRNYKYSSYISNFPRVESLYVIREAILGLHELNYKYYLIDTEYIGTKNKVRRIGWEYFVHCREFIDKAFKEWLRLHELDDNLDMSDKDIDAVIIKIAREIIVAKERLDKISYSDSISDMCVSVNLCLGVMHSNGILLVDYGDSSITLDFLDKLHSHDYNSVWKAEVEEELS